MPNYSNCRQPAIVSYASASRGQAKWAFACTLRVADRWPRRKETLTNRPDMLLQVSGDCFGPPAMTSTANKPRRGSVSHSARSEGIRAAMHPEFRSSRKIRRSRGYEAALAPRRRQGIESSLLPASQRMRPATRGARRSALHRFRQLASRCGKCVGTDDGESKSSVPCSSAGRVWKRQKTTAGERRMSCPLPRTPAGSKSLPSAGGPWSLVRRNRVRRKRKSSVELRRAWLE